MEYFGNVPNEYQEVEYIQSSGTQYIDTGYIITPNTEISADFQFTTTTSQQMVFGIGQDNSTSSGINFNVYIGGSITWAVGLSDGTTSNSWNDSGASANTNRNKFVLNNGTFKIYNSSGTLLNTTNTKTTISRNATHSFGIFARRETYYSVFKNLSSGKLYGFQVKESGTLVRDFIPCYRKSDGVIGLYDRISKTFFTNAGSGSFLKGHDVNVKRSEFQKVEYIQSSGTQYIDTQISAPNGFRGVLRVSAVESASESKTLIGTHNTSSPYGRNNINLFTQGNTWGLHMNDEMINGLGSITLGQIYEVDGSTILGASYLDVDEVRLTTGNNTSPMSSNNLLICANQYEIYSSQVHLKAKIYSCKLYKDGTLVRDFIPCYRKSDNVIGMIDDVNKVFYTNDGTGTFTKGGDIN